MKKVNDSLIESCKDAYHHRGAAEEDVFKQDSWNVLFVIVSRNGREVTYCLTFARLQGPPEGLSFDEVNVTER